ncbi:MAG: type I-E CRISPR-associated protein Cas7/Cse4/CasC [Chloroflexi bacterium]|nr:type I-E CRISPR-associated protein Cas7/Cse4/CasC [Chloroflexota bacterium]
MFVELHILQNFAPSNLNRDDTGSPKDCEFGGYRRARVSSQCLKRAIRSRFSSEGGLQQGELGKRTKRLVDELVKRLQDKRKDPVQARPVVETALRGLGLGLNDDGKTEYLLFLGEAEMRRVADVCAECWDTLVEAAAAAASAAGTGQSGRGAGAKDAKKSGKEAVPVEVKKALETVLDGGLAADLALFGRMVADRPDKNVDAACQVAHAISTNKVSTEFDFYTAVDDLKPDDIAGADMLGTVEFNSACFYRYANIDVEQLKNNLGGGEELARKTIEAFIRASVVAVPTGKQNSMAAQNPPSFVMAVARERGLWSLANAFARPVRPDGSGDLVENSIAALDGYWGRLCTMYGNNGIVGPWYVSLDGAKLKCVGECAGNVDKLVEGVMVAVKFAKEAQA